MGIAEGISIVIMLVNLMRDIASRATAAGALVMKAQTEGRDLTEEEANGVRAARHGALAALKATVAAMPDDPEPEPDEPELLPVPEG